MCASHNILNWQHKEHDIQSCTAVFRRTHASQHEPRQTRRIHAPRSVPKTLSWLVFLDNNIQRTTTIYAIHLKKITTKVTNNPHYHHTTHHIRFTAFFRDNPGEPVPEQNFWILWCKGRLTERDTPAIRLGDTPSRPISAHLHHPPFFRGRMPFLPPNRVKALKANNPH